MNRREALKTTLLAMGYTISVPAVISIFESCNSNTSQKWKTEFFSAWQANVIGEMAETILPRTKTPGAKDLNIDRFIDKIVKQVFSQGDQQVFLKGMEAFEKKCKDTNGKDFISCSPAQRSELLKEMEKISDKTPSSVWGIVMKNTGHLPFYRQVKSLVLLGYFTSEETGKKILVYDPVPGEYQADIPLTKAGNISFE